MNNAWMSQYFNCISYISELDLKQLFLEKGFYLRVPLSVSFHMLSILSDHRLGNRSKCLQTLTDLQTLLLYDDGTYVPLEVRDISWQILGICQQVVGDLHGALQSYQQSFTQIPLHKLRSVSATRMCLVLHQLNV